MIFNLQKTILESPTTIKKVKNVIDDALNNQRHIPLLYQVSILKQKRSNIPKKTLLFLTSPPSEASLFLHTPQQERLLDWMTPLSFASQA